MNILLLEDDFILCREISAFLRSNHYQCDCIYDGSLVLSQYRTKTYDIVILDINVPKLNGFEACKAIRNIDSVVPILMLTALGEIEDKTHAFNSGADDYLVKPFHFDELLLRIKSLYRRKEILYTENELIRVGDLVINITETKVYKADIPINLTPKEYKLLTILAKAKGRVLSKQQIADELWDYHIETNQNTIEVYINFLRKKIDKESSTKLIHTKVGYGYYLKAEN